MSANLERMEKQLVQMEAKMKAKDQQLSKEQEKRMKIMQDVSCSTLLRFLKFLLFKIQERF